MICILKKEFYVKDRIPNGIYKQKQSFFRGF